MVAISVIITSKVITEGRLSDCHVCRARQSVSPAARRRCAPQHPAKSGGMSSLSHRKDVWVILTSHSLALASHNFYASLKKRSEMMERIRKEMILMERGLHSPTAGKRLSNLSDSAGNAVLEALENSPHSGRLSPRLTAASLHSAIGDISAKGKFEIDTLFSLQHPSSESTVSSEIPPSESRKKISLYSEVAQEADMNSDVEVGCSALRSPASLTSSQLKENSNKGNSSFIISI
ncbi:PREDICTED: homeobox even-skipped homolog protein 2 [Pygoscelis adeliae]|uniref:homeobox even-skipped homolog protein 2 n=1 Tax=Pygoscelis adeliae TaxID=9238 RepID=UPI0004F453FF|nr:PREDICTED: homeobox even-skipped homolog protein 2 [Pygoscelis adeliae]